MRHLLCTICLFVAGPFASRARAADPVVSNVRVRQRAGTELVDILYDAQDADSAALSVSVRISSDGGTTWTVPATTLSGNGIGANVSPGTNKSIVWDAAADWDGQWSDRMRVEVTATDSGGTPPADEFVLIPGGTNSGTDPDFGAYSLTVSSFYMGRTEVTWGTWRTVRDWAAANGYDIGGVGAGKADTHPVHSMNWYDAVKWCNARSQMEDRTPCYTVSGSVYTTGQPGGVSDIACNVSASGYRLPTDVEWEYAARGGVAGKRFPWGDTITHSRANYYSSSSYSYDVSPTRGYHPTYNDGTYPYTSPVGSFAANAYGLYDMAGNVWEWCWDWYPGYEGSIRVIRGGGWSYFAYYCRAGNRYCYRPVNRYYYDGFRACSAAACQ